MLFTPRPRRVGRLAALAVATALVLGGIRTGLAAPARILKVLPQYVDQQGRHALSPSLYDRDAYQALLRRSPERCSGMRFAIQWRAPHPSARSLQLKLELITTKRPATQPLVLVTSVAPNHRWSRWDDITLKGDAFRSAGDVLAWRVTLWDSTQRLAEEKSFLW